MIMKFKHNCCKQCKFEWYKIFVGEGECRDILKCNICGRLFEEIENK